MLFANYLLLYDDLRGGARVVYAMWIGQDRREMLRYGVDGMSAPTDALRGKVMHARFEGPGILFYASDNHDAEPMRGSAHFLVMDDREGTDRIFRLLAEGGVVTTPLGIRPWGDYYGKLTDRFGVQWMLDFPIRPRSR